jgi:GNAT superfamily N-acetyltransferase
MVDHHMIIVSVFQSAYSAKNGVLSMPASDDSFVALHCVTVESYDESGHAFRFHNNWGSSWGDGGYGTMSLEYAQEYFHEGWIFRPARWGAIPAKRARISGLVADPRDLRRTWSIENPRFVGRLSGPGKNHNSRWCSYEAMSAVLDCPVTCIEVKSGFGLRMGWAFVRHLDDGVAEIPELFVWPAFRHAGIGAWLEAQCVAEAETKGFTEVNLILNETDSVVGPLRRQARCFASSRGYEMRWRSRVAPRAPATAVKHIESG